MKPADTRDRPLRGVGAWFFQAWSESFERRRGYPRSTSYVRSLRLALRGPFRFGDTCDLLVDAAGIELRNPLRGLEVPGSATPNIATVSTESEARILAAAHTPRAEKFYAHLSDARLRAELEAAFISSPYPGVQPEASDANRNSLKSCVLCHWLS